MLSWMIVAAFFGVVALLSTGWMFLLEVHPRCAIAIAFSPFIVGFVWIVHLVVEEQMKVHS